MVAAADAWRQGSRAVSRLMTRMVMVTVQYGCERWCGVASAIVVPIVLVGHTALRVCVLVVLLRTHVAEACSLAVMILGMTVGKWLSASAPGRALRKWWVNTAYALRRAFAARVK